MTKEFATNKDGEAFFVGARIWCSIEKMHGRIVAIISKGRASDNEADDGEHGVVRIDWDDGMTSECTVNYLDVA